MQYQEAKRSPAEILSEPVITSGHSYKSVTDKIVSIVLSDKLQPGWMAAITVAAILYSLMFISLFWLFFYGIGVWGVNNPVGWGFAIINLVWWIGIGHAGTLISAILLLFRQDWRTSINRFAEAMTLFAVACAGVFPIVHVGRPWLAFWLAPVPMTTGMWPNYRSALAWDVAAISTYALVSLMFWYVGLVPDLATIRDTAKNKLVKMMYGLFALGWRGSAMHWKRYNTAYFILAGLSMPLVFSVHTVISFDFATSQVPGWHVTIFPPYFVAGAVFAGFAMVLTLAIPLRHLYGLKDFITMHHINNMAKVMLATGLFVVYGYSMELFFGLIYSANDYEYYVTINRMVGPYAWAYWGLIFCNGVVPQLLWLTSVRSNEFMLFCIANVVSVGMWLERFVIIPISLHRDFLPSSWGMYIPTFWDISLFIGTIGQFFFLFFLFIKLLPMISIFEVRELVHHKMHEHSH